MGHALGAQPVEPVSQHRQITYQPGPHNKALHQKDGGLCCHRRSVVSLDYKGGPSLSKMRNFWGSSIPTEAVVLPLYAGWCRAGPTDVHEILQEAHNRI